MEHGGKLAAEHRLAVDALRDLDDIGQTLPVRHLTEAGDLVDLHAAGDAFLAADADLDQEIPADRLSDTPQHHERETRPVLQTAAVVVRATVHARREKLMQQPAVPAEDVNAVKSGALHKRGAARVVAGNAVHHGLVHCYVVDAVLLLPGAGTDGGFVFTGLADLGLPAVVQLDHRYSAVFFDG